MVTKIQYHITGHAGLPGLSTLHFIGESDATGAQTIVDRVAQTWTQLAGLMRTGTTVTTTGVATVMDDATGNVIAQWPTSVEEVVGTNINPRLPVGSQGLLLLRTGVYVGGREVRGRVFIPGPTDDSNTAGGAPESSYLQACADAFDTNLWAPVDFPLAVWSPTYLTIRPLSSITGSPYWARLSTRQR